MQGRSRLLDLLLCRHTEGRRLGGVCRGLFAALCGDFGGSVWLAGGAALGGLAVSGLNLHAPAGAALSSIPHPAARAGWHGDLSLAAPRWQCPADGRCSGEASLLWRGAGSALFPGRSFGDYQLQVGAEAGSLRFTLATLAGPIMASGQGEAPYGQQPRFDGQLSGDPELLRRLPAIAGGAARPGNQPGHFEIHWPPR